MLSAKRKNSVSKYFFLPYFELSKYFFNTVLESIRFSFTRDVRSPFEDKRCAITAKENHFQKSSRVFHSNGEPRALRPKRCHSISSDDAGNARMSHTSAFFQYANDAYVVAGIWRRARVQERVLAKLFLQGVAYDTEQS